MSDVLASFRRHLTGRDALLFVAAVVGLALYVLLLPGQHPDASADYSISESKAEEEARSFLAASGIAVDDLQAEVEFRRQEDLLNALQRQLGRPETVRVLAEDETPVPGYYWRVQYFDQGRLTDDVSIEYASGSDEEVRQELHHEVSLTQDGLVWNVQTHVADGEASEVTDVDRDRVFKRTDRRALRAVLLGRPSDTDTSLARGAPLEAFSDSLLLASLAFDSGDTLWQQAAQPAMFDGTRIVETLQSGDSALVRIGLGPDAAAALARYHLARTLWGEEMFRADSAWIVPERNGRVAGVRFVRTMPLAGQPVRADVQVTASGALERIDTRFPETQTENTTLDNVASVVQVIGYVVLILTLLLAFFKRLGARRIDGKAALIDAVVLGASTAISIGLIQDFDFDTGEVPNLWVQVLIRVGLMLAGGIGMAVFIAVLSGATDSLAREHGLERQLRAASLLRMGSFRNPFVGVSLLRGVALGGVLLGALTVYLWLIPQSILSFDDGVMLPDEFWQPMAAQAAEAGRKVFFLLLLLLGAAGLAHRPRRREWVVVALFTLVVTLLSASIPALDLWPESYDWGFSAILGIVMGLTFWYYGFLTAFVAPFTAGLIWSLNEGWLVEGSPLELDVMLAAALLLTLCAVGLVGVGRGATRREMGDYVPDYVQEITFQERMKRELEIAHQVQESLLPRRMPEVEGVDLAAMCLAAMEVGGDYYDFVEVEPGRLAVVIGDVSGKGIQAAFYMTLAKGIWQTLCREEPSPAELLRRLNALFCQNAPRGTFISMICGVLDVEGRAFTFARAGHNPVIVRRSPSQDPELIQPAGLAIGLTPGPRFDQTIEEVQLDLRMGDVLVFYTDGFSEAMNRAKRQYGDERLAERVGMVAQRSAGEILRFVSEDVHHFVEGTGRHDDMTMVVIKLSRRQGFRPGVEVQREPLARA